MKTLKTLFVTLLVAAFAMPLFNGCKKGEEDPGISWKSRNGRVTGTWTLKSFDMSGTTSDIRNIVNEVNDDQYDRTIKTTWSESFNGSTRVVNRTYKEDYTNVTMWYDAPDWRDQEAVYTMDSSYSTTTVWGLTISLYTDNTYEMTETSGNVTGSWDFDWDLDYDDDNDPNVTDNDDKNDGTMSTTGSATSVSQGAWYWEDNTKKNKLFINAGGLKGKVVRLSSKEMIVEVQYGALNSIDQAVGFEGEGTSDVGSNTDVQEQTIDKYTTGQGPGMDTKDDDETTVDNWSDTEVIGRWVFEKTDKNSKRHKAGGSE